MKTLILIAFSVVFALITQADEGFERNKTVLDRKLYNTAPLVVRTVVRSEGAGSKYLWADTVLHGIMKIPKGVNISPLLKVAYRSEGQGLPIGDVTLYLELYNPNKPELGWKLIERFDKQTKKFSKGYSHESKTTKMQNKTLHTIYDQPERSKL